MKRAIGVDLGGCHVTAGVITDEGKILCRHEQDIDDRAFERVVDAVVHVITAALDDAGKDVIAIGIGSPGNIEPQTGTVVYSPNFGWADAPFGNAVRKHFPQPVFVGNDARCATLGEHRFGVGKGTQDFALVTLGTGIGGGIVGAGHLLLGHKWGAGEVGHHQIRPTDGFVCMCGKIGCFEAQASGTGLIRHTIALQSSFPRSSLVDVARDRLSSKKIRKAAQGGDLHACAAWKNYTYDLATGLAHIIAFVNPEVIALGGGVSSAGKFLVEAVRDRAAALTTMVPKGSTRIEIAKLGNDAGQVGAAIMALRGGLQNC